MTTNRLAGNADRGNSPKDPQACCDWANARMKAEMLERWEWVTTGNPDQPIRLAYQGG